MFEIQLTIISLTAGFLLGRTFPKKQNNISSDEMRIIFQEELIKLQKTVK